MKKSMCITYKVGSGLYVNMTNRCSNACEFCIRNNADGAYGSDSLWLIREPSVEEILSSVLSWDLTGLSELVFCGYGEPSYRLDDARTVAIAVKAEYPNIKIRINTNGQSDLIHGTETARAYDVFDTVSISLNSPSAKGYTDICHPIFGEQAYPAILKFAKEVRKYVADTVFSVVRDFLSEEELIRCRVIADECGVALRIRDYIPPEPEHPKSRLS